MPRGLDLYSFQARVIPVLVVLLPVLVLLGGAIVAGTARAVGSTLVLAVVTAVAAQIGRDRGKRLEPGLWAGWGGSPTLRRLRFADAPDAGVVERLHRRIETVLLDPLPTPEEEAKDPVSADARYEEATRRLIGRTRDRKQFDLLFKENVNYGMRRNLLGLRTIGGWVAAATATVAAALILLGSGSVGQRGARYGPGLGIALVALLFWLVVVTREWVRVPAEAYGDRLIEAVDVLSSAVEGASATGAAG